MFCLGFFLVAVKRNLAKACIITQELCKKQLLYWRNDGRQISLPLCLPMIFQNNHVTNINSLMRKDPSPAEVSSSPLQAQSAKQPLTGSSAKTP